MELTAIIEALMVASDDPLPSSELARLIRARVAEMEDELLAQSEDDGTDYTEETGEKTSETTPSPPQLPDEIKQFAEISESEIVAAISQLNEAIKRQDALSEPWNVPKAGKSTPLPNTATSSNISSPVASPSVFPAQPWKLSPSWPIASP